MKVVMRKVAEITPYENNPRANAKTVEELKKSIERYGFNVPLVIDKAGVVICGHARLQAAEELKLKTVPCVVADLTEEQAKRYRLADNRVQDLTKWNQQSLVFEIREIEELRDVPGFTDRDVSLYSDMFSSTMPERRKAPVRYAEGMTDEQAQAGGETPTEAAGPMPANVGGALGNHGERQPEMKRGVTQRQIDNTRMTERTKFVERDEKYQESLVKVVCQCCGKTFSVLKTDIERI